MSKLFIKLQDEFGSFNSYIWQFTDGNTIHNKFIYHSEINKTSNLSNKMSKELKKRGFKFVDSTICYTFMQASGMVNNHTVNFFLDIKKYRKLVLINSSLCLNLHE